MKEEFKAFVRTKPELAKYVNSGEMTWQRFYEQWSLYGSDSEVWNKYKKEEVKTSDKKTTEGFSFSNIMEMAKQIDMDSVQKGINSVQKALELFQGLVTKDTASNVSKAQHGARQLFKKFED